MFPRPWFYYFGNWFLRLAFRILMRVELSGLEHVPRKVGLIIAISHSSFLDPLFVGAFVRRDVVPMAKIEAFSWPIIGWIVKSYGAFPVRRGEADTGAFKMALRILHSGGAVIIAPEGHRSHTGALQKGREGAIILSLRSGAPILPVAVWGGKAFWKNLTHLQRTDINFSVGAPVLPVATATKPTRTSIGEMSDELMLRIAQMMPPEIHGYYTGQVRDAVPKHLQTYCESVSPSKEVIAI